MNFEQNLNFIFILVILNWKEVKFKHLIFMQEHSLHICYQPLYYYYFFKNQFDYYLHLVIQDYSKMEHPISIKHHFNLYFLNDLKDFQVLYYHFLFRFSFNSAILFKIVTLHLVNLVRLIFIYSRCFSHDYSSNLMHPSFFDYLYLYCCYL